MDEEKIKIGSLVRYESDDFKLFKRTKEYLEDIEYYANRIFYVTEVIIQDKLFRLEKVDIHSFGGHTDGNYIADVFDLEKLPDDYPDNPLLYEYEQERVERFRRFYSYKPDFFLNNKVKLKNLPRYLHDMMKQGDQLRIHDVKKEEIGFKYKLILNDEMIIDCWFNGEDMLFGNHKFSKRPEQTE